MGKYILKRLLLMIPTVFLVIFIVFTILNMTPGSPGRTILGENASQEAVNEVNEKLGYNKPFLVRFGNYVLNLLKGDLGTSYMNNEPVVKKVLSRYPVTAKLAVMGISLTGVIGITFGVISAVKQYSLLDYTCTVGAMLLSVMPIFWLGLLMIILFSVTLHWLPVGGVVSWKGYIMPVAALAITKSGQIIRMTRSAMLEKIRCDYVRTARAKGIPESKVILRHALKNALLPVITVLGTSFGYTLGGAVLAERVFSIPGLGTLIVDSIYQKDIPVVMGAIVLIATSFCLVVLLVDLLYAFIDPRIKAMYKKERSGG